MDIAERSSVEKLVNLINTAEEQADRIIVELAVLDSGKIKLRAGAIKFKMKAARAELRGIIMGVEGSDRCRRCGGPVPVPKGSANNCQDCGHTAMDLP